uniref:TRPM-like domain-containing protein n=1 Tax=Monopterus albus TaxID=43700 RepID=A0A3Q3R2C2_MONAL
WKSQLELAIAWNRVDLAKTEIFTEESQWESSELHWAMRSALVGNKPQFVRLLLETGVSVRDFLQDEQTLIYENLARTINYSINANTVLYFFLYQSENKAQRDPCRDLFLWAVIQNNKELAEIAWEQCTDCMCAALVASKILKKMAEEGSDADEAKDMQALASHYEKHAIGVFSECHSSDQERAQKLLVRASPFWGRTTCLRLALEADDKSFVAQSGVQVLLTQIWCGELSVDNPVWRVMFCMVFFPLIYTGFLPTNRRLKPLGCWSRLVSLYSSPQVKFYWNIVFYFAFLLLFAVVLTTDFQATPSAGELLLYICLFSLVCEEVRQVRDGTRMYIKDLWNILDVLSILLFVIGFAFRLTSELFYAGKILLCIDFVVFCLRLMAIFTISRTLGPKIIIVKKMVRGLYTNVPYLIIFGNFPTDIDKIQFDINSCSTNGTDPLKPKCPVLNEDQTPAFPEWLTIIMLCVYFLDADVVFFTFQVVQDNTDIIWKFQRYELIKEYHSRPAAPPPFIILSHLYLVLCRRPIVCKEFKNELDQTEEEELLTWEALMKDRYLLSTQQEQSQSMEGRILDTAQK